MVLARVSILTILTLLAPALAGANEQGACTGPGAAFGVTSYNCAKCATHVDGARTIFRFYVEPVVLSVDEGSLLRVGDVVLAVNGQRITTPQGSTAFTYPTAGTTVIDVRRDGKPTAVRIETAGCRAPEPSAIPWTVPSPGLLVHKGGPAPPDADTGVFGFAAGCLPSCTRTRSLARTYYWKFDGKPPIVAIRPGSPAESAGLRVGDTIVDVDGMSVLTEPGALRLVTSQSGKQITLTVVREGKSLTFTITRREP